ncbi:hypothetical protein BS47DRAFT_519315 [Hydnum rufescens UP504]|uniref:Uncharacterized protein n=1 Tax=Hydnum rufescens UP504 TaxID=1448309 RepID=A0A9P6AHS7_9AGAM|nr:hypothetical protein BS47DRAFT_519315 [Hydnum rufescens UP504]
MYRYNMRSVSPQSPSKRGAFGAGVWGGESIQAHSTNTCCAIRSSTVINPTKRGCCGEYLYRPSSNRVGYSTLEPPPIVPTTILSRVPSDPLILFLAAEPRVVVVVVGTLEGIAICVCGGPTSSESSAAARVRGF